MICLYSEHDDLQNKLNKLAIELAEAKASVKYLEKAKLDLEVELGKVKQERAQMLEDLLIASGVKMDKYQQEFIDRQKSNSEKEPSYLGQARHWGQMRTEDVLNKIALDQRIDAKRMIEDLEKELD